jgi:hypothetical protein
MSITTDISKFGHRELEMLRDIMNAWLDKGLPHDFTPVEVVPMFNMNSGCVFLTNEDHQVCMVEDDELQSFYSCPECGHEGFFHEMDNEGKQCCSDYVREVRGL